MKMFLEGEAELDLVFSFVFQGHRLLRFIANFNRAEIETTVSALRETLIWAHIYVSLSF